MKQCLNGFDRGREDRRQGLATNSQQQTTRSTQSIRNLCFVHLFIVVSVMF